MIVQSIKTKKKSSITVILAAVAIIMIVANILFIMFTTNAANTTKLLKMELTNLEHDAQILSSAEAIYSKYSSEIDIVNAVFPNGETIPEFIQQLENEIRRNADEYSVKFNSVTPLTEQDKLFLPLTITLKTDLPRLLKFFEDLERFPYMTHVNSMLTKTNAGFAGLAETTIGLKVYVQNPFTTE